MLPTLIVLFCLALILAFAALSIQVVFELTEKLLTFLWHALLWLCDATGYLTLAVFHVLTSKKI